MKVKKTKRNFFEWVLFVSNALGSLWICALMCIITADVLLRVVFHMPLEGTPEIVSNSLVMIAFLQIGFVLYEKRHVRATVLYDKFPENGRKILDIITSLIGVVLFIAVIYSSWGLFVTAVQVGEFEGEGALRVPTSPVRFVILYGSLLMAIQFLVSMVQTIRSFSAGNSHKADEPENV
jgi:TRAP-type C4-dicarboxylate transport system permease small subunit